MDGSECIYFWRPITRSGSDVAWLCKAYAFVPASTTPQYSESGVVVKDANPISIYAEEHLWTSSSWHSSSFYPPLRLTHQHTMLFLQQARSPAILGFPEE